MKKIACLFVPLVLLFCSACGNTELSFVMETQESRQADENIDTQDTDIIYSDKLTYTNLDSESSVSEVREILTKAGIQTEYVDTVLEWSSDYNNCMRE
ncbi:MAG: DUF4300 family protein, partial [Oscillospiraceae bacterium]|nr:DUF4300 family protein [Oscillospiraceae bacterium]